MGIKSRSAFFYTACVGYFIALILHILSVFKINPEAVLPYPFLLHGGALLVFFAAIIHLKKKSADSASSQEKFIAGSNSLPFVSRFSRNLPGWLVTLLTITFFYTLINMIWFFISGPEGQAEIEAGAYVMKKKGKFI